MGKKRLTNDEIAFFCEQLSLVISAGIPLSEGTEMISDSAEGSRLTMIAQDVGKKVAAGKQLYEAMEETGAFPEYTVNMVKIGSLSGRLDDVLKGLTAYYEQAASRVRALRGAVLHPIILIAMMATVMIVLIVQVLPMFADIFGRFNSIVGEVVDASVDYAYSMGMVILIVLCIILVISGLVFILARIPSMRARLNAFVAKVAHNGKSAKVFSQAKFANAMSMMVSSGIEASDALENTTFIIDDKNMCKRINECRDKVVSGTPLADAVNEADILPPIYTRTLKVAYKSGAFDEAWKKISDRLSEEAEVTSDNLVSFIEPVLIAIMAVMIGAVLLTVMLPMLDIMSKIG